MGVRVDQAGQEDVVGQDSPVCIGILLAQLPTVAERDDATVLKGHRAVLDDRPGLDGQQPAWFQELDHVRSLNPDPMLFGPWMGEA